MKKTRCFYIFFFLACIFGHAQTLITGTVVSSNKLPIEGASVYINNSTIGTTTDADGNFEFLARNGKFELVISFIGYKTIIYDLDTDIYVNPLSFKLLRAVNFLDEAVVRKTKYDQNWKYNLNQFKLSFLGRTQLASQCKILNPKVLSFEFDKTTGTLSAFAKEPLQIENKGLGYLITYDLVHFSLDRKKITYLGLTKYQNLKGKKAKQKRWAKKRLKAYQGSLMHFMRSLYTEKLKTEGYLVNQFKRVQNTQRPSEEQINKARAYLRSNSSKNRPINLSKKIDAPKTLLDSAIWTIQKQTLPKYRDYLYKKNVSYKNLIMKNQTEVLLNFENYLSIIYTKEPEEINYTINERVRNKQTSTLTMTRKTAIIDPSGVVIHPFDIFAEGYWSYEQFADLLPRDYQPHNN